MGPYKVLPLPVGGDLGVIAIKEYYTLPRSPELVGWLDFMLFEPLEII